MFSNPGIQEDKGVVKINLLENEHQTILQTHIALCWEESL